MSLKVAIFVCLLANFLFSYRGYEAANIKKPLKFDVVINKDKNLCNETWNIRNFKYTKECGKLDFLDDNSNVTRENLDKFICTALDDRYMKICQFKENLIEKNNENVLMFNNETLFNKSVEKYMENGDALLWGLCGMFVNVPLPSYDKTNISVTKFHSKISDQAECAKLCDNKNKTINPLCITLAIIDDKLNKIILNDGNKKKSLNTNSSVSTVSNTLNTNKSNINKNYEHLSINQPKNPVMSEAEAQPPVTTDNKIQTNGKLISKESKTSTTIKIDKTEKLSSNDDVNGHKLPVDSKPVQEHTNDKPAEINNDPDKKAIAPLDNVAKDVKNDKIELNEKSTTLEQAHEDDVDQSDYRQTMPDDDQLTKPDNNEFSLDAQRLPKDDLQLDDEAIDETENEPKLPSISKDDDTHFLGYFTIIGVIGICGCLMYHRKQKILAMIVEGRRSRGGRGRKRPSTANYRKLDSNLEEAVTSQCNSNVTHVIY